MHDVAVLDSTIHYEDTSTGSAMVFRHRSPDSSHLWSNVIPDVGSGRRLASGLIGMGQSGKPDIAYQFADHARYLDAWFDALGQAEVVLVCHDWGGALAFDWASRHPESARGRRDSSHGGPPATTDHPDRGTRSPRHRGFNRTLDRVLHTSSAENADDKQGGTHHDPGPDPH